MVNKKISVLFFGTPEFAATCMSGLLSSEKYKVVAAVTNPDRPAGRGKSLTASAVKQLADKHNIPVFQSPSLRKENTKFKDWLAQFGQIDVGIVVAFGQILSKEVLTHPLFGCINVHASILPRWRGAAPINRAIIAGDTKTGVALMQMEEGLDTGGVYSESIVTISDNDIASELHDKLAQNASLLLVDYLPKIISKNLSASAQIKSTEDELKITYAQKISNEELRINWNLSAHQILRFIHGVSYKPGAFTFINKVRLKIFRVKIDADSTTHSSAVPGTILFANGNILSIKTGDNKALHILEAQLEGKKKLPISEIILSGIFNSGDILI